MDDAAPADPAPPQFALEYERPLSAARRGKTWLLAIASVLLSLGVGLVGYGIMVVSHSRDDAATFIAVGLSLLTLGISSVALFFYTRRP